MNENSKLVLPGMPGSGNPELVKMLEDALAKVRSGQVVGVGLVMVHGAEAISMGAGGVHPLSIAAGCRQVAQQMEDTVFKKRSNIMPARFS